MVRYIIIFFLALMIFSCNRKLENIEKQKYIELGGSKIKISDTTIINVRVNTDYIHPDRLSFFLNTIINDNSNSFCDVKELKFNVICDSAVTISTYTQKSILAYIEIMKNEEFISVTEYIIDSLSNKSFEVGNDVIEFVLEENDYENLKLNFYDLVYFYVKSKSNKDSCQFVMYDKIFREILNNYNYLVEIDAPFDKELKEILDIYQIIAPDSSNYIKPTFKR